MLHYFLITLLYSKKLFAPYKFVKTTENWDISRVTQVENIQSNKGNSKLKLSAHSRTDWWRNLLHNERYSVCNNFSHFSMISINFWGINNAITSFKQFEIPPKKNLQINPFILKEIYFCAKDVLTWKIGSHKCLLLYEKLSQNCLKMTLILKFIVKFW